MVAKGGARQDYQVNLGADIAGGQDKADQEGNPIADRSGEIRGNQAEVWRCGDRGG